jgi:hypothetical protein
MNYYAKVVNNRVMQVIAAEQDLIDSGKLGDPDLWIPASDTGGIRINFPSVGFSYDAMRDAFIPPKPYPSWVLDEATCQWSAPIAAPDTGLTYNWIEQTKNWLLVEPS